MWFIIIISDRFESPWAWGWMQLLYSNRSPLLIISSIRWYVNKLKQLWCWRNSFNVDNNNFIARDRWTCPRMSKSLTRPLMLSLLFQLHSNPLSLTMDAIIILLFQFHLNPLSSTMDVKLFCSIRTLWVWRSLDNGCYYFTSKCIQFISRLESSGEYRCMIIVPKTSRFLLVYQE